eukprot:5674930-Amphidinium_carterae.1
MVWQCVPRMFSGKWPRPIACTKLCMARSGGGCGSSNNAVPPDAEDFSWAYKNGKLSPEIACKSSRAGNRHFKQVLARN